MSFLPTLNATLNALSALLIAFGLVMIKKRRIEAHRYCMIAALVTSAIFLASYLIYHFNYGATKFVGTGLARWFYFAVLISHTVLAAIVLPMILTTFYRAYKGQFEKHKNIARWTFPIWLYVSITGVVVYIMLYHLYPSRG
ncbi:MAG: DUF420 domain-containing protein [Acidobacteriota bacterium]|nr:DUF420 domain-containing protein [Blastocatellia bacterium]MDW8411276.1 DUF420 domain-containing protein [Acidobacteriota bacterium]